MKQENNNPNDIDIDNIKKRKYESLNKNNQVSSSRYILPLSTSSSSDSWFEPVSLEFPFTHPKANENNPVPKCKEKEKPKLNKPSWVIPKLTSLSFHTKNAKLQESKVLCFAIDNRFLRSLYWYKPQKKGEEEQIKKDLTCFVPNIMSTKMTDKRKQQQDLTCQGKIELQTRTKEGETHVFFQKQQWGEEIWYGVPRFYGERKWGRISNNTDEEEIILAQLWKEKLQKSQPQCSHVVQILEDYLVLNGLTKGKPMHHQVVFEATLGNTPQRPQEAALRAWKEHEGSGLIVMPCGYGKTRLAVAAAIEEKACTLVVCHLSEQCLQWIDNIKTLAPKARIGILKGKKREVEGKDFVIASVLSLVKKPLPLSLYYDVGTLIVDECHHYAAPCFKYIFQMLRPRYVMALSATPQQNRQLYPYLYQFTGDLAFEAKRQDVKPQEVTQYVFDQWFPYPEKWKQSKSPIFIKQKISSLLEQNEKRNQYLLQLLWELNHKPEVSKILCISSRVAHLELFYHTVVHFQNMLSHASGAHDTHVPLWNVGLYTGRVKKKDLTAAREKRIIFATDKMAGEFLDIPGLNAILVMMPPSCNWIQLIGRNRETQLPNGQWASRFVVDVADDFGPLQGKAWNRYHQCQELKYLVKRYNYEQHSVQISDHSSSSSIENKSPPYSLALLFSSFRRINQSITHIKSSFKKK